MEKLQEQGWYLSEEGYDLVSDFGSIGDVEKIIRRAIDMDLKEIGSGRGDLTEGNLVLQIQKLRNIAAPKYNEESRAAPRMLKLSLTDGKNNYQAVETERISGIGLNTPPGTKLLLKSGGVTHSHGLLLLGGKSVARVLDARVAHLVEKWELNRKLATHSRLRSAEEGGPPAWIPFGKKIIKGGLERDKNFKSLGKDADKETTEFEAQRQDAIAEAARLGGKKVFGGGNKQLLDHSVRRIVDQGFSVEQAEYALKINRNHVERALKSLQRTNESRSGGAREPREPPRSKRFEKKCEETKPSSAKVSLFDFLEDKLPARSDQPETRYHFRYQTSEENNGVASSEKQFERLELRGLENSQAGKGGRGERGGRGYAAAPPRHAFDESRYAKRSSQDPHDSALAAATATTAAAAAGAYQSFGNVHQSDRPPRFQRNQETRGNNEQQDGGSKSTHPKAFRDNDRRNNAVTPLWQSRGEIGLFNLTDTAATTTTICTKKNQRSHDRVVKNHRATDTSYQQQTNNEPKSKHVPVYDSSYGKQNRGRDEPSHKTSSNTFDSNYKSQSNRQHCSVASNEPYKYYCPNNRNSNNEFSGAPWVWKLGDHCMAKYWEDNQYYNAQVTAISATTCVVRFKDFDNYEEVLQDDCIPITEEPQEYSPPAAAPPTNRRNDQRGYGGRQARSDQLDNHISGMEFRRGGGGAGGGGGNLGPKGYHRKRGQQRSAQPIYQPPAQRTQPSGAWNARDNPPV